MDDIFHFTVVEEIEMAVRLGLAALLGGAIGFERRQAEKPRRCPNAGPGFDGIGHVHSGFRVWLRVRRPVAHRGPGRVTGIGFLGAGTIMRIGADVQGLTSASSIWLVAGVGMAVGTGMYIVSVIGAILALFVIHFFPRQRTGAGDTSNDE